jgi:hypothetical protein
MAAEGKAANSRVAGRIRWVKRIARWAGSGQTQKAYCAKRGWALSTFQWWRARMKQAPARNSAAVSFLPLTLAPAPKEPAAAAVEVELSSKTRIRFEGAVAERATDRLLARIR